MQPVLNYGFLPLPCNLAEWIASSKGSPLSSRSAIKIPCEEGLCPWITDNISLYCEMVKSALRLQENSFAWTLFRCA